MIVMWIKDINGSCEIPGYDKNTGRGSWFPCQSLSFGFSETSKKRSKPQKDEFASLMKLQAKGEKEFRNGMEALVQQLVSQQLEGSDDEAYTELSVTKNIDSATCDLMNFSLRHRNLTKQQAQQNRQYLSAEARFLHVAGVGVSVPYLFLKMEQVLIKSWSLDGSEEGRPTESFTLWFDQSAMKYQSTTDGKTFKVQGERGWKQAENTAWDDAFSSR